MSEKIRAELCDITKMEVDAIVNAANNSLLGGGGVDGAIHAAAGRELLKECKTLKGCDTGDAKITNGYNLKAKYVIHTVGPMYHRRKAEKCAEQLASCYKRSLEVARENDVHSIVFPAISTGIYGYPLKDATIIAVENVTNWLKENNDYDISVIFSCFDKKTLEVYQEILTNNN